MKKNEFIALLKNEVSWDTALAAAYPEIPEDIFEEVDLQSATKVYRICYNEAIKSHLQKELENAFQSKSTSLVDLLSAYDDLHSEKDGKLKEIIEHKIDELNPTPKECLDIIGKFNSYDISLLLTPIIIRQLEKFEDLFNTYISINPTDKVKGGDQLKKLKSDLCDKLISWKGTMHLASADFDDLSELYRLVTLRDKENDKLINFLIDQMLNTARKFEHWDLVFQISCWRINKEFPEAAFKKIKISDNCNPKYLLSLLDFMATQGKLIDQNKTNLNSWIVKIEGRIMEITRSVEELTLVLTKTTSQNLLDFSLSRIGELMPIDKILELSHEVKLGNSKLISTVAKKMLQNGATKEQWLMLICRSQIPGLPYLAKYLDLSYADWHRIYIGREEEEQDMAIEEMMRLAGSLKEWSFIYQICKKDQYKEMAIQKLRELANKAE